MNSQPLPPPLPTLSSISSTGGSSPDFRPSSSGTRPNSLAKQDNDGANLLSSQKFRDELAIKQARLSPNPEAQQTIDEKIQLRKANQRLADGANLHAPGFDSARCLPDELAGSSATLQRDKRPFAYSPDVSDPNNRGKLDLSQIKSPIMRRRLMANMEDSQEQPTNDNEQHQQQQQQQQQQLRFEAWTASRRLDDNLRTSPVVASEHVAIRLVDADALQRPPSYHISPDPRRSRTVVRTQPPVAATRAKVAQSCPTNQPLEPPTIVHYNEPPRFHNVQRENMSGTTEHKPELRPQPPCPSSDYLKTLDAEIADSLENLSLLVSNLEARPAPHSRQVHGMSTDNDRLTRSSRPHDDQLPSVNYTDTHHCHQNVPFQPKNVSTFLPTPPGDGNGRMQTGGEAPRATPNHQQKQQQAPSFYATLPSGRPVADYCSLSNSTATSYFGTSPSDSGPYSMLPFYSGPLGVDQLPAALQATQPVWTGSGKPASHGTFCANRNSSAAQLNTNSMSDRNMEAPSGLHSHQTHHHHHQQSPPFSTQHQHHHPAARTSLARVGGNNDDDQVRALRKMTAKLEREVERLHSMHLGTR